MIAAETLKKTGAPKIVKLNKALKLAEAWVNNMSQDADDEITHADKEDRPPRLGLGAKVSRQSRVVYSDDPVERKLYTKLDADKRKTTKIAEVSATTARVGLNDNEDDGHLESRTSAFAKRKTSVSLTSSMLGNKKQK